MLDGFIPKLPKILHHDVKVPSDWTILKLRTTSIHFNSRLILEEKLEFD